MMKAWSKRTKIVAIVVGAMLWGALTSFLFWLIEAPTFYYVVIGVTSVAMAYGFIYITIRNLR